MIYCVFCSQGMFFVALFAHKGISESSLGWIFLHENKGWARRRLIVWWTLSWIVCVWKRRLCVRSRLSESCSATNAAIRMQGKQISLQFRIELHQVCCCIATPWQPSTASQGERFADIFMQNKAGWCIEPAVNMRLMINEERTAESSHSSNLTSNSNVC